MLVYLTKAYQFNAGHRLFDPRKDDAWNLQVFGKCSFAGGHGHNYRLEVSVRGEPHPESGLVVPGSVIDEAVQVAVMDRIDHRNLNDVLSNEYGPTPTTEVLILELWRAIAPKIPRPAQLHRLTVSETSKNSFDYFGPARG
jgi:6-pyruvoyltetrahydropterin/6-carboxytetrahydropterin synthase